jgi:predicted N-formylglutamate amidohydrolase
VRPRRLVLSCEHGGNRVPASCAQLFRSARARRALTSHRGYDIGALAIARALARRFGVPLTQSTVTRLLVDLNRSLGHRALFSEFSRDLEPDLRAALLQTHYHPYRESVRQRIGAALASSRTVVHISVHSFVPTLAGITRNADIGLLYDSRRGRERVLCEQWHRALGDRGPTLRVRRNYPYRGAADGLTTALRREFAARDYIGIELEINQAALTGASMRRLIEAVVGDTLEDVLA